MSRNKGGCRDILVGRAAPQVVVRGEAQSLLESDLPSHLRTRRYND
jgi:hypothetical protein